MSGPTSASSRGSGDSTSPSKPSDFDASDKSNGTNPVDESLSDTGPTYRDGEMLLPTPQAHDQAKGQAARYKRHGTKHGDANLNDHIAHLLPTPRFEGFDAGNHRGQPDGLNQTVRMLPTPSANQYESQSAETIEARRSAEAEKGRNGNGFGLTTAMALTLLQADSPASPSQPPAGARRRPTHDGSGPSTPESFAILDPDGSWLKTYPDSSVQATLLGPPLQKFSGTWPRSGMTRHGEAFALPTWVRPTDESASSSLLPTPDTMPDAYQTTPRKAANFETGHAVSLGQRMLHLHTPTATDGSPRYDHRASPGYVRAKPVPNLDAQIADLLPTPVSDHSRGLAQTGTDYQSLPNAVLSLGDHTNQPSEDGSE